MSDIGERCLALLTDDWQPTADIAERSGLRHIARASVVSHTYHALAMLEKGGQAESKVERRVRYWRLARRDAA